MQESRIHFYDLTVILLRTLAALALPPTTCVVRLLGDQITVEQMSNKVPSWQVDPNSYRIFVGGLRKTTTEDRIHAHFARFGEVQVVEIKRQPDGTSRGFAFVRFARLDSVDRAIEAHAQHMIDNKWVDVKRHDNDAHSAGPASAYRDDRERKKKQATASSDDDAVDDRKAARSMLQQSMKTAMGQVDGDEKAEKGDEPEHESGNDDGNDEHDEPDDDGLHEPHDGHEYDGYAVQVVMQQMGSPKLEVAHKAMARETLEVFQVRGCVGKAAWVVMAAVVALAAVLVVAALVALAVVAALAAGPVVAVAAALAVVAVLAVEAVVAVVAALAAVAALAVVAIVAVVAVVAAPAAELVLVAVVVLVVVAVVDVAVVVAVVQALVAVVVGVVATACWPQVLATASASTVQESSEIFASGLPRASTEPGGGFVGGSTEGGEETELQRRRRQNGGNNESKNGTRQHGSTAAPTTHEEVSAISQPPLDIEAIAVLLQRRLLAISVEEARRREQKAHEDAKARGANSVSTQAVDSMFSVLFGLGIACWYFDWFAVREQTRVERLTSWLRSREVAVVAFELDNVMCCRSRGEKGVTLFQLEDYFAGVSQEFVEVAAALARRGFFMSAVVHGRPNEGGDRRDAVQSSRWWQSSKEANQPELVDGAELARKLIASRCPEALSSFKVFTCVGGPLQSRPVSLNRAGPSEEVGRVMSSVDDCIQYVAKEHRVSARRVVLFTASKELARDGADESWTAIHVPSSTEGFRFDDIQLPKDGESGWFELPEIIFNKVLHLIRLA
ncbi:sqd [Symbiodinium sp. CCMP2592]|nr:sqd [Symbiodinium sp. CCMP2592]